MIKHFFNLLLLSIRIDEKTILKWFGLEPTKDSSGFYNSNYESDISNDFLNSNSSSSASLLIETSKALVDGLWNKLQSGLTLAEIENVLFFVLFIRFVFLSIKYNLKTSFYITCITFVSGYLWYRHLIDVMLLYRNILLKIPFFHKLGVSALELRALSRQSVRNDVMLNDNVHWYDVGQLIYYAFTKGIVDVDPMTGLRSYIDPLSMFISNLDEPLKSNLIPYYYKVYNKIIPKIFSICARFWTQLSGLAAYALITRIGKRYCPYLIRWHWTVLLILGFPEQILFFLTNRIIYFQSFVLIPQAMSLEQIDPSLVFEINFLNAALAGIAIMHTSFVLLGTFHAICGQYLYIPFFVENAELHIGPRPKDRVYSGGYTSWQDREEKEKNVKAVFPRIWYGWLGKRRTGNQKLFRFLSDSLKKIIRLGLKKLKKK